MIGRVRDLVPDVHRIAVLRANALGDFIFVLPALDALKAAYPHAELVLLGAPWHAGLLRDRPGPIDRVLVVPPAHGIRTADPDETAEPESSMAEFLDTARRERFDLALQMHGGGGNSNPLVSALGARLTAGLRAKDAPPLDRWMRYVYYQPEVVRYLEVAGLVGAQPAGLVPRFAVTDADRAEAAAVLGPPGRLRIALHPGASDPRRRWPAERFAEVADRLVADGYDVFVTGTPGERELADRVVAAARMPLRSLAGELSLAGLVGFLSGCAVVVSNDTGPVHLAAAVDTPTVGIFWVGNLINCAVPLRARHRPIGSWTLNCPVCGVDGSGDIYPARPNVGRCAHQESFVTDVPVVEVLAAVADLVATADR
jgi:ADP-heptose:LPS heptosyltransferase